MKITKTQLKQIIKEELEGVLEAQTPRWSSDRYGAKSTDSPLGSPLRWAKGKMGLPRDKTEKFRARFALSMLDPDPKTSRKYFRDVHGGGVRQSFRADSWSPELGGTDFEASHRDRDAVTDKVIEFILGSKEISNLVNQAQGISYQPTRDAILRFAVDLQHPGPNDTIDPRGSEVERFKAKLDKIIERSKEGGRGGTAGKKEFDRRQAADARDPRFQQGAPSYRYRRPKGS